MKFIDQNEPGRTVCGHKPLRACQQQEIKAIFT